MVTGRSELGESEMGRRGRATDISEEIRYQEKKLRRKLSPFQDDRAILRLPLFNVIYRVFIMPVQDYHLLLEKEMSFAQNSHFNSYRINTYE
jgi:hypothetical protein